MFIAITIYVYTATCTEEIGVKVGRDATPYKNIGIAIMIIYIDTIHAEEIEVEQILGREQRYS